MNTVSRLPKLALAALATVVGGTAIAANHNVSVGSAGLTFSPANLTIAAGDTITFRNAGGLHNVVSDAAGFRCATSCNGSGGNVSTSNWVATVTFNTPGEFDFYCDAHGGPNFGMSGSVTVEGASNPPPPLTPGYTGTWYDPAQSGQGIFVEILPGNQMLAFWFTFSPEGQQAWFGGVGPIEGNRAVIPAVRTTGTRFIPNFNPAETTRGQWGTMTITLTDCSNGRVDFNSTLGFGSGSMILKRLSLPAGLECPPPATATARIDDAK
jgi:plastocyanin